MEFLITIIVAIVRGKIGLKLKILAGALSFL